MMTHEVEVQRAHGGNVAPDDASLRRWARAALDSAAGPSALGLRLVGEAEGTELNRRFRDRDGPTNVLSFPFEAAEFTDPPLLGDVVVCVPVIEREAREQDKQPDAHYAHMVVHGVLHLLGHDHEDEPGARAMEALEIEVLAGLGFEDPYRGRDEEGLRA